MGFPDWAYNIEEEELPKEIWFQSSKRDMVAHPSKLKNIEEVFRNEILLCVDDLSDCMLETVPIDGQRIEFWANVYGGKADKLTVFFYVRPKGSKKT